LIHAITELGIRVPEQVSVLGFDNLDSGEYFKIPLTTVHVPAYEIGRRAAELLIRQIRSPGPVHYEKIFFPTKPVVRNSCAKKP
jgi:DNA-binding LacI/PurR family transcriptional regulator